MPDMPFSLGSGELEAARAALTNRRQQLLGQENIALGEHPSGAVPPPMGSAMSAPVQLNGQQMAGQALMAGANQLGQRPMVTPQQQAQLVEMLKARMRQQQMQQPPQPQPQPGMPPPGVPPQGLPPMLQNAPPIPGMQ